MLISIKTTPAGINTVSDYANESNDKLNFLDATVLACSINGTTLPELGQAIEQEYPMPITNMHLIEKLSSLEKMGFIFCVHSIQDSAMIVVKYNNLVFKTRFSDFLSLNPKVDGDWIKRELPYHKEVVVKVDNSTIFVVRLA